MFSARYAPYSAWILVGGHAPSAFSAPSGASGDKHFVGASGFAAVHAKALIKRLVGTNNGRKHAEASRPGSPPWGRIFAENRVPSKAPDVNPGDRLSLVLTFSCDSGGILERFLRSRNSPASDEPITAVTAMTGALPAENLQCVQDRVGGMDVTFIANDTRGGVEPYLALVGEAVSRGHTVRALAPPEYAEQFRNAGSVFAPLRGADRAAMTAHGGNVGMREMGRLVSTLAAEWARDAAAFTAGTEMVIAGIGGLPLARPVAQYVGAPLLRAHLQPIEAPSSVYPGPLMPQLDANAVTRRLSHRMTATGVSMLTRPPERAARKALDLPAPVAPLPEILYGFSPTVVPVASDAQTRRSATGYWTLPAQGNPPIGLQEFLESGRPAVAIGFGSMHGDDPGALRDLVVTATRQVGVRAVLLSGWGALTTNQSDDADVFTVDAVAHSWLFPRVAATVHHGGAGTTGAALAAGVPTVVVPFGADQPFWARRAHRLGASPPPIPRSKLTADRLASALEAALTDAGMKTRATDIGDAIHNETGIRTAIDAIEAAAAGV